MKTIVLKHEEMLLALLRSALTLNTADERIFYNVNDKQWKDCFLLAVDHGVKALAFDGVLTLSEERRPPQKLFLQWALSVSDSEKLYEKHCCTVSELSDYYSKHGIATMQMKGVGFSTYYPKPEHREGGDIDIFTRSADTSAMSDDEANALADTLMEKQGIDVERTTYKHSVFFYKGIPFENHKCYLNVKTVKMSVPVEMELRKVDKPVKTSLLDGKYVINTPSDAFNTLFISFHAMQHVGSGICLHHICDWACLLNRCGMDLPAELTDRRYHRMLSMLNSFAARFLGCEAPTTCTEKELDMFYDVIMRSKKDADIESSNPVVILYTKVSHLFRYAVMRKKILGESVIRCFAGSIVSHLCKPSTIFTRN